MRAPRLERSDAQVIASLLVSAVMLGVKVTSLNAIIRTINRKQELKMLVAELNLKRSRGSNIPVELMQRARRASERWNRPAEIETVCVLRSGASGAHFANTACSLMHRGEHASSLRRSFP
jgi:hypothetical protein